MCCFTLWLFRASQPKLSVEHQTRRDETFEKWVRASFKILSCCSTGNKYINVWKRKNSSHPFHRRKEESRIKSYFHSGRPETTSFPSVLLLHFRPQCSSLLRSQTCELCGGPCRDRCVRKTFFCHL